MKNKPPHNLAEMFPTLNDEIKSSEYALELIYRANAFINNTELIDDIDVVMTSDRQGQHLFSNSIEELQDWGIHHLNYIHISTKLPHSKGKNTNALYKFSIPSKKFLVIVDAINNGTEIREIAKFIKENNGEIKSIYSYLINRDTLEKLKNEADFQNIIIKGEHIVSKDDYDTIHQKFITFSHSLKKPADREHFYAEYLFSPRLTKDDTTKIIIDIKNNLTKKISFSSTENKLAADSDLHRRITIETDAPSFLCNEFDIPKKIEGFLSLERLEIRFIISNEAKKHTHIIVIIIPMPEVFVESILQKEECKDIVNRCIYKNANISESSEEDYHYIICPQCLENYIASVIYKKMDNIINNIMAKSKYKIVGSKICNPNSNILEIY